MKPRTHVQSHTSYVGDFWHPNLMTGQTDLDSSQTGCQTVAPVEPVPLSFCHAHYAIEFPIKLES